jgi:uncharacterized protein (TIGR02284 family)
MITNDDKAVAALNSLIHVGRDAEQGYMAAADAVAEPELIQTFADFALERAKFVVELKHRVKTLRAEPADLGTLAGDAHRTWTGLRTILETNEAHAILSECERGEDAAVMVYREALAERDIDPQTRGLIQRQYEQVQAAHDRVRQLRDSATYANR